jgi:hypothetical protein
VGHAIRAEQLTERERQILPLLAAGWTNREIAAQLGVKVGPGSPSHLLLCAAQAKRTPWAPLRQRP